MTKSRFKIVIFGDAQVGKTQLIKKLENSDTQFVPAYKATIGADFSTKSKNDITLGFWDTAGKEGFRLLASAFFRNANIGILCIDLSAPLDMVKIEKELDFFSTCQDIQNIPIILVGTKSDLERKVSDTEFDQVIKESSSNIVKGFKVSSKKNEGPTDLLDTLFKYAELAEPAETTELAEPAESLNSTETFKRSSIDEALAHLPLSELHTKICQLKDHISELSSKTQDLIGSEVLELINKLKLKESSEFKAQAIEEFETKCISHLGGSHPIIKSIIIGVVVTAIVTVLAALVGFGIGFLAGAWTGPGAFITGFMAGSAAAVSVVSASSVVGTGLGIFAGVRSYNNLMNQNELVHDIADSARVGYLTSP